MWSNEKYACALAFGFSQYISLHHQISTKGNHVLQVLLGYANTLFNDTATFQDYIAMVMYEYGALVESHSRGKPLDLEKDLSWCHFPKHKSHRD